MSHFRKFVPNVVVYVADYVHSEFPEDGVDPSTYMAK
jgi:hypothetical protein